MSVQQLRPPVVTGWVEVASESVTAAAAVPKAAVADAELAESLTKVAVLESQVVALKCEILAEADRRKVAGQTGDTGTDAWAAKLTGTTRAVMAGGIWLANLLRTKYAATREAFAAGAIEEAQVRVIVKAGEKLPDQVTDEQRARAEAALVAKAVAGMNARRLRHAARRMLEVISRELADAHEADQLEDEEQAAEAETWLSIHDNGDGTVSGRFTIPELHGALLRAALERLSAPRRLSRNQAGNLVTDPTLPGAGPTLSWTEKLGTAFTELLEHLPTDGHGSVGATIMVHLQLAHLLGGLASAKLDTGTRISPGQTRRLACNAGIIPAVLGGKSEPLDVGREQRLHTKTHRRALSVSYDTCAAEGCDRPFAWCEIHHPHAWADGGATSVHNGIPLCGHHHRRAHDDRYTLRILPTGEVRYRRRR